jgi:hypothetical protein
LLKGEADMRIRKPGGRLAAVIELHEQQPPPSLFQEAVGDRLLLDAGPVRLTPRMA